MKKLVTIMTLIFSFSIFANDKIAYIVNEVDKAGAYELCETEYNDASAKANLLMTMLLVENSASDLDLDISFSALNSKDDSAACVVLKKESK